MSDMRENLQAVIKYLDDKGYSYDFYGEQSIVEFKLNCGSRCDKLNPLRMLFMCGDSLVHFCVRFCISVPEDKRYKVAEYIARANYSSLYCHIDMDWRGGNVSFVSNLDCTDGPPTKQMLSDCIGSGTSMMSKYGMGLIKVIYEVVSPKKIIKDIED